MDFLCQLVQKFTRTMQKQGLTSNVTTVRLITSTSTFCATFHLTRKHWELELFVSTVILYKRISAADFS